MIFDKIENIDKYSEIPSDIKSFIKSLSDFVKPGRYKLAAGNYANIDEYFTKSSSDCKFEAHKKYIDIQLLLTGREELQYSFTNALIISENYDENRDVMFFENPDFPLNKIVLEKGVFVLLYPYEAHKPQINYDNIPSKVKKTVVKIKV